MHRGYGRSLFSTWHTDGSYRAYHQPKPPDHFLLGCTPAYCSPVFLLVFNCRRDQLPLVSFIRDWLMYLGNPNGQRFSLCISPPYRLRYPASNHLGWPPWEQAAALQIFFSLEHKLEMSHLVQELQYCGVKEMFHLTLVSVPCDPFPSCPSYLCAKRSFMASSSPRKLPHALHLVI